MMADYDTVTSEIEMLMDKILEKDPRNNPEAGADRVIITDDFGLFEGWISTYSGKCKYTGNGQELRFHEGTTIRRMTHEEIKEEFDTDPDTYEWEDSYLIGAVLTEQYSKQIIENVIHQIEKDFLTIQQRHGLGIDTMCFTYLMEGKENKGVMELIGLLREIDKSHLNIQAFLGISDDTGVCYFVDDKDTLKLIKSEFSDKVIRGTAFNKSGLSVLYKPIIDEPLISDRLDQGDVIIGVYSTKNTDSSENKRIIDMIEQNLKDLDKKDLGNLNSISYFLMDPDIDWGEADNVESVQQIVPEHYMDSASKHIEDAKDSIDKAMECVKNILLSSNIEIEFHTGNEVLDKGLCEYLTEVEFDVENRVLEISCNLNSGMMKAIMTEKKCDHELIIKMLDNCGNVVDSFNLTGSPTYNPINANLREPNKILLNIEYSIL